MQCFVTFLSIAVSYVKTMNPFKTNQKQDSLKDKNTAQGRWPRAVAVLFFTCCTDSYTEAAAQITLYSSYVILLCFRRRISSDLFGSYLLH
jgi:hypothetical protein